MDNVQFHLNFDQTWDSDRSEHVVRNKILAIKLLREATGLGLRESKLAVEESDGRTFLTSCESFGHLQALLAVSQNRSTHPVHAYIGSVVLVPSKRADVIDCT
jgi:predicted P-loop ATPase